jgi:hypothetical protein
MGTISICSQYTDMSFNATKSGPGHCWIVWAPDKNDTQFPSGAGTWGTYGDSSGGGALTRNREANSIADACQVQHISDASEAQMVATISFYQDLGNSAWSGKNNCCKFAHDVWSAATGDDIPWEILGNGNPNVVTNSLSGRK